MRLPVDRRSIKASPQLLKQIRHHQCRPARINGQVFQPSDKFSRLIEERIKEGLGGLVSNPLAYSNPPGFRDRLENVGLFCRFEIIPLRIILLAVNMTVYKTGEPLVRRMPFRCFRVVRLCARDLLWFPMASNNAPTAVIVPRQKQSSAVSLLHRRPRLPIA